MYCITTNIFAIIQVFKDIMKGTRVMEFKFTSKSEDDTIELAQNMESEKFANMVENLARMRDALRAMVNYICNILCIAEVLKAIIEIFRAIAKAIESLINFSWTKLFDKISDAIKKAGKAIE